MKHCVPGNGGRSVVKRCLRFLLLVLLLVSAAGELDEGWAEEKMPHFQQPVLITPPGQNPDGLMVKVILQKLGIAYQYIPLAKEKDIHSAKSVIMTVGISNKGLGASGISYEEELKRTKALVATCLERKCPIVFVDLGGKARRGGKSDQLIYAVAPYSSCLILTQDSDEDRYFSKLAEQKHIPLKVANKIGQIESFLKELYAGQK